MKKNEFKDFRYAENEWKVKKKEIALEILDILKSNKLSVFQTYEVMEVVDRTVKCQAHL